MKEVPRDFTQSMEQIARLNHLRPEQTELVVSEEIHLKDLLLDAHHPQQILRKVMVAVGVKAGKMAEGLLVTMIPQTLPLFSIFPSLDLHK